MRVPHRHEFRTARSPRELFARLPARNRFRLAGPGRVDTFGAEPIAVWSAAAGSATPFDDLVAALRTMPLLPVTSSEFLGGALCAFSYESGFPLVHLAPAQGPDPSWFAVYDTVARSVATDRVEVVSFGLTDDGRFDDRLAHERGQRLEDRLRSDEPTTGPAGKPALGGEPAIGRRTGGEVPRAPRTSLPRDEHSERIEEVLRAIRRGDIYQANLTAHFEIETERDPVDLFEELLEANPAPFATLLETDAGTIVSCSPERLLSAHGRRLESRPIKGTIGRSPDPASDRALGRQLLGSEKDQAELLMITDLTRNDLGRVARVGSVSVPRLRELESFPHVHHLVSTVRAELPPSLDVFDALRALLPYGSITGAPKRRAVEILRELEPVRRGIYTGAIGWVGFDRSADFAVAIRTGVWRDGTFSFGAGGGVVADSRPEAEWEELHLKATAFTLALTRERAPESSP